MFYHYGHCSKRVQFSLSILLLGVGIATVTDLQLNALGSFLSFLAVITTCVSQIVSFKKVPILLVAQVFNETMNQIKKIYCALAHMH